MFGWRGKGELFGKMLLLQLNKYGIEWNCENWKYESSMNFCSQTFVFYKLVHPLFHYEQILNTMM